ncbi:3-deoxy-D-arabino-heptulosonate 7-phosphate (DAHP) synthase class II [Prauserella sediminis]|uniref:3-deoxy-D-arabino-heptulosonate 7-phosphate (DAHP) synthase class II n=1 Tax=Prauserella sediminis TaxID=577680 RepID=A0A839XIU3_9PSEU|nr:hypothetical protein [Prauserella sediminis]MBB3662447.1 3-deoxy-D-arabino-heptulosonate 7-phosphate (DAHP) synthase class II [Prauserella sediminis]
MATRKVLTINIEFELADRKASPKRLNAVYDAAVKSATDAATRELLEGGVAEVRHRMTFDYRWADQTSTTPIGDYEDWADDEPATNDAD